jgi:predicted ArsR family transcriptional regulator
VNPLASSRPVGFRNRRQILILLAFHKEITPRQITYELRIHISNIHRWLDQLMDEGIVYKPCWGRYALSAYGKEQFNYLTDSYAVVEFKDYGAGI